MGTCDYYGDRIWRVHIHVCVSVWIVGIKRGYITTLYLGNTYNPSSPLPCQIVSGILHSFQSLVSTYQSVVSVLVVSSKPASLTTGTLALRGSPLFN